MNKKPTIMIKYLFWRSMESNKSTEMCVIASYGTKSEAMMALRVFASIIGKEVAFEEGTEFGAEPAIWAWSVIDESGAKYYITEEEVDEDGNVIDPFGF